MRVLELTFALALVACSPKSAREKACEAGDPAACDELAAQYAARAATLCTASDSGACAKFKAIPLDLPKAATSGDIQPIFLVALAADGRTAVDDKTVPDDAVLSLARSAKEKNADLRAVIKADAAVPHGRVIHVLDLLKQAGISKIAFAVVPIPP